MTQSDFDKLSTRKQLIVIDEIGIKIDSFIPWFGNIRISTLYSISNFFVELVMDIETRKFESINTFNNIKFLSKYPQYLYKIDREIKNQIR
ncbi:hypothetical protein [Mesoflavibacter sp. CH_XMU1422-2]|uniref:hypothetical protein n=1 Tax=Mesoflavibacter sp. CH_XMU1422-2 TaxID=3107770 RepID=UPI0030096841